jgi:hypothetical protein
MKPLVLQNFDKACNQVLIAFCEIYFKDCYDKDELYWVCDEVGTIVFINDYFFDLGFMVEALRLNADVDLLFQFYDYTLDCAMNKKKQKYNFKSFLSLNEKNKRK